MWQRRASNAVRVNVTVSRLVFEDLREQTQVWKECKYAVCESYKVLKVMLAIISFYTFTQSTVSSDHKITSCKLPVFLWRRNLWPCVTASYPLEIPRGKMCWQNVTKTDSWSYEYLPAPSDTITVCCALNTYNCTICNMHMALFL